MAAGPSRTRFGLPDHYRPDLKILYFQTHQAPDDCEASPLRAHDIAPNTFFPFEPSPFFCIRSFFATVAADLCRLALISPFDISYEELPFLHVKVKIRQPRLLLVITPLFSVEDAE
jgi:hypothetical protein